jgi:anti-sigma regulatory factor (Ser/Thr protein kinase)
VASTDRLTPKPPHDHVVNLYDCDQDVVAAVAAFVAEGLHGEEVVLVIATSSHRSEVDRVLRLGGLDVGGARAAGRYVFLDARETLAQFMADGKPDPARFREVVGTLVAEAEATGRPVRAFGEMVALLWDDGDLAGAIELERLWNDLSRDHRFVLYCAYPVDALAASGDLGATGDVCRQHSQIIPPSSYASGAGEIDEVASEGSWRRTRFFVPDATAISAVRRFVTQTLVRWSRSELIDDAVLVASELATNAVRHAQSPFVFMVEREGAGVRMSLQDLSDEQPVMRRSSPHQAGGRGIALIQTLSHAWGTEPLADGKLVWSELA